MAKIVVINTDADGFFFFFWRVKLLVGKTRNDGEQIIECLLHKILLLKESEIWFPNKDGKCQDGLTSWGEPVVSCYRHCVGETVLKTFEMERLVCADCLCFRILINLFFRYFLCMI